MSYLTRRPGMWQNQITNLVHPLPEYGVPTRFSPLPTAVILNRALLYTERLFSTVPLLPSSPQSPSQSVLHPRPIPVWLHFPAAERRENLRLETGFRRGHLSVAPPSTFATLSKALPSTPPSLRALNNIHSAPSHGCVIDKYFHAFLALD